MPIEVVGLREIRRNFKKFNFTMPRAKQRYLTMIGNEAITLLMRNTPRDTGELANSWMVLGRGFDYIDIGVPLEQQAILSFVSEGTVYQIAQPFLQYVGGVINMIIMETLQYTLAQSHPLMRTITSKQRKRQQVGRTSAGFKGGTSFAGRATMIRPGTGRRQLKRRLSLRRRKGKSINAARKDVIIS